MKILYAEDDKMIQELLAEKLEKNFSNCEVVCCSNAIDAIDLLNNGLFFDLVISDQMMGGEGRNGTDLLQFFYDGYSNHPPVIITSGSPSSELSFYRDKISFSFIEKPFDTKNVLETCECLLKKNFVA